MHKSRSVQRCMNPNPRHSQCTLHAKEHTALLIAQCTCSVCVTTDKTLNKNWCVRYDAAPIHKCSVCEARVWSNARLHTAAISKSFGRRRGWRDKSQIWPSLELFPSSVFHPSRVANFSLSSARSMSTGPTDAIPSVQQKSAANTRQFRYSYSNPTQGNSQAALCIYHPPF